jgi:HlyD family secretion protein
VATALSSPFVIADNAVHNRTDQFFKNISSSPYFEVSFTDGNYVHYFKVPSEVTLDINNSRKQVEVILDNWQDRTTNLNQSNLVAESEKALVDLNYIASFLNKVASAVNTFSPAEYAYESTVTTYKTAVSSARTEVANAISDLVSAKDKFNTAPTLGVGGQFEDILAQESKVAQAQSSVAAFEASFNKTIIRAPFSGVVTLQDAKVGNAVSPGNTLISIISQNQMYVEANISEIQIGKIKMGDKVSITFDAFPNEKFSGAVAYIEPGDVIIDGVVNYKIRVSLDSYEERIKSGLTANLKIETARKSGVLAVPLYAVLKEDGKAFANKKIGEKEYQKVPIELGLSGNNGLVEVLSGLSEGDTLEF